MSFIDLDSTTPSKTDTPPAGVILNTRAAGRGDKKTRYIALRIGALAAKAVGIHLDTQVMAVRAGTGQDHGKLAVICDTKGKFQAKKQKSGVYLLTISAGAVAGRFTIDFDAVVVEKARIVPAHGAIPPMLILTMPEEAVEPE